MKNWVSLLFAAAVQLAPSALAADANAWKSRNIYFALTDRVARSSSDNGGGSCGNLGNYCGGTFKGLEGKLDYIAGMGFDAIWITPVVASRFNSLPKLFTFNKSTKIHPEATMGIGLRTCTLSTATTVAQTT